MLVSFLGVSGMQAVGEAKKGDCCVFCSYSETPCPPIQKNESCC